MIGSVIWLPANELASSVRLYPLSNKPYRPPICVMAFLSRIFSGSGVQMIKKAEGGYKVLSEKGKNLGGPYKTKKEAEKRLQQVEFFKHKKG
jgi:hypothetical protein